MICSVCTHQITEDERFTNDDEGYLFCERCGIECGLLLPPMDEDGEIEWDILEREYGPDFRIPCSGFNE